jgi:hypothetical protein
MRLGIGNALIDQPTIYLRVSAEPQPRREEAMLRMLLASDPGDHQLHESYAADNLKHFTRKDFGWAKAQFAEFVLKSILGRMPLPVPPKPGIDTHVTDLPFQITFSQSGGIFNAAPH